MWLQSQARLSDFHIPGHRWCVHGFLLSVVRGERDVWTLFFWQDSGPYSAPAVLSDTCQEGAQRLHDIPSPSPLPPA